MTGRDDDPDLKEQPGRVFLAERIGFLCALEDFEDEASSYRRPALEVPLQDAPKLGKILLEIFALPDGRDILFEPPL